MIGWGPRRSTATKRAKLMRHDLDRTPLFESKLSMRMKVVTNGAKGIGLGFQPNRHSIQILILIR
jgi:hypothetical protein